MCPALPLPALLRWPLLVALTSKQPPFLPRLPPSVSPTNKFCLSDSQTSTAGHATGAMKPAAQASSGLDCARSASQRQPFSPPIHRAPLLVGRWFAQGCKEGRCDANPSVLPIGGTVGKAQHESCKPFSDYSTSSLLRLAPNGRGYAPRRHGRRWQAARGSRQDDVASIQQALQQELPIVITSTASSRLSFDLNMVVPPKSAATLPSVCNNGLRAQGADTSSGATGEWWQGSMTRSCLALLSVPQ